MAGYRRPSQSGSTNGAALEKKLGLPVYRDVSGAVYADKAEVDAWRTSSTAHPSEVPNIADAASVPGGLASSENRVRTLAVGAGCALGPGLVAAAILFGVRAPQDPPSLAVLGFKNLSGRAEAGWLSTALSENLRMELAFTG